MTFAPARPIKAKPKSTGIAFCANLRGGGGAAFYLSPAFQQEQFDEPIKGWRFTVHVGRGDDEGKVQLRPCAEDAAVTENDVTVRSRLKGTASLMVMPWDLIGPEPQKSQPCKVLECDPEKGLLIELPGWCQPTARKARDLARSNPKPRS